MNISNGVKRVVEVWREDAQRRSVAVFDSDAAAKIIQNEVVEPERERTRRLIREIKQLPGYPTATRRKTGAGGQMVTSFDILIDRVEQIERETGEKVE